MLASHLGYTMSRNADLVVPMMVGKLVAGVCAETLAILIYREDTVKAEKGSISKSA